MCWINKVLHPSLSRSFHPADEWYQSLPQCNEILSPIISHTHTHTSLLVQVQSDYGLSKYFAPQRYDMKMSVLRIQRERKRAHEEGRSNDARWVIKRDSTFPLRTTHTHTHTHIDFYYLTQKFTQKHYCHKPHSNNSSNSHLLAHSFGYSCCGDGKDMKMLLSDQCRLGQTEGNRK